MSLSVDQVVGYQRAEFARAAKLKNWLLLLQFLVALPAAVSVLFDDGVILYYLALGGGVLLGIYIWTDGAYRRHREAAESGRRATLICEGLGEALSPADQLRLRTAFQVSEAQARAAEMPGYFASKVLAGPERLGEMLEESAFWTETLQSASAKVTAVIFGIVVVVFFAAAVWLPFSNPSSLVTGARVVLAVLAFLLSADVYGTFTGHRSASNSIREIRLRLTRICARNYPLGDVLLAMSDYNAAVEAAPLQIPLVYRWMQSRLNADWKEYRDAQATACKDAVAP